MCFKSWRFRFMGNPVSEVTTISGHQRLPWGKEQCSATITVYPICVSLHTLTRKLESYLDFWASVKFQFSSGNVIVTCMNGWSSASWTLYALCLVHLKITPSRLILLQRKCGRDFSLEDFSAWVSMLGMCAINIPQVSLSPDLVFALIKSSWGVKFI